MHIFLDYSIVLTKNNIKCFNIKIKYYLQNKIMFLKDIDFKMKINYNENR